MKVVLTTLGKFHSFDLARQLHARGLLSAIYSGYPRFKLRAEGLPAALVRTFPYLHAPYMATAWRERLGRSLLRQWEYWDRTALDRFVASTLPEADVFVGLSGCGLATGMAAHRRGMKVVCDRGSTHIRHQDEVMREEHRRWGLPHEGIDPRIVEREEAEYDAADLITVPSSVVRATFTHRGVAPTRVRVLSYGVDLQRFRPVAEPERDRFDLLFVGNVCLRKGIPVLLQAFKALPHPRKSLTLAGTADPAVLARMGELGLMDGDIRWLGHVPQPELKALMSRSHALVLPSVEEGLAMVMAQAMACACPVVASRQTGADDLYTDGVEGFIVPGGDPRALARRLDDLAGDPVLRKQMAAAALQRVQSMGGWASYGEQATRLYRQMV